MLPALIGPTAAGKTEAAIEIARRVGAEIVSVDSMLVYRGLDLGTAKPTPAQRSSVPHHLLDLAEPSERFTVARYQRLGREALARIERPLLVGGSGLYLRALVDDLELPPEHPPTRAELEAEARVGGAGRLRRRLAGLDPAAAGRIEPGNLRRTIRALEVAAVSGRTFSSFATAWETYDAARLRAAGITMPAAARRTRIEHRVHAMLDAGWLDEVRGLVERGLARWLTSSKAIGYEELARHLAGELTIDEAVARTIGRTVELARRQLAWFRKDPRIRWFESDAGASAVVDEVLAYLWPDADQEVGASVGGLRDLRR
jgi:tRNA dimethylallyltransferase